MTNVSVSSIVAIRAESLTAAPYLGRILKSRPASQAIIDDQITVLNNTFSGGEGRVDTGFRFTLAGVDRTVNLDWYNAEDQRRRARHEAGSAHRRPGNAQPVLHGVHGRPGGPHAGRL